MLAAADPCREILNMWDPLIQGGFAVFALVLLAVIVFLVGVIVYLFGRLIGVLRDNAKVIQGNTRAIEKISESTDRMEACWKRVHELLLQRPCLRDEDGG
jgi:F0F1-type ATP synthase membrane subunit b/b'